MNHWKEVRLGDISIGLGSYGIGAPAVPKDESLYTYLRITDINDDGSLNYTDLKSVNDSNAKKYLLNPNDIVFARTGNSTGRTYFYDGSDGDLVYAGFLIKFSLDPKKVNPKILKYYTHSKVYYDWVASFDSGATRGNINAKTYADMPISLPPRIVQDRIVGILSALDEKIETNRKINARLEEMAQAIFKSWFIDFTPFGGQMPKDWEEKSLKHFIQIETGFPFKSESYKEKGLYKLVTIKAVQDGYLNTQGADYINQIPFKMPSYCFLQIGDILLSLTGNVGRVCVVDRENLLLNQRVAKLSPLNEIDKPFTYLLFRQNSFKNSLIALANGTAQLNLSPILTGEIKLNIPTREVLNRFANAITGIFKIKTRIERENARLAELRDTLLPKLMSGEIKVH